MLGTTPNRRSDDASGRSRPSSLGPRVVRQLRVEKAKADKVAVAVGPLQSPPGVSNSGARGRCFPQHSNGSRLVRCGRWHSYMRLTDNQRAASLGELALICAERTRQVGGVQFSSASRVLFSTEREQ
jgi:hypothetical protein